MIEEFHKFKYNLYELVNVKDTEDYSKIKDNIMKLIKSFHPDKNSEIELDIYNHIILAKKILLNKNLRESYDNFIARRDFLKLKETFRNCKPIKFDKSFKELETELNENFIKKHNNIKITKDNIVELYTKIKECRNNENKNRILKELDIKQFNDIFEDLNKNKYTNQEIVVYNHSNGINFSNLIDIGKLYSEDKMNTHFYSVIDV